MDLIIKNDNMTLNKEKYKILSENTYKEIMFDLQTMNNINNIYKYILSNNLTELKKIDIKIIVDFKDENNNNFLHIMANTNCLYDILKYLLTIGVDRTAKNNFNQTPYNLFKQCCNVQYCGYFELDEKIKYDRHFIIGGNTISIKNNTNNNNAT